MVGKGKKIMVIPDCQVRPGVPLDHLKWAGLYAKEKKPDVIVCLGDFADMESLCSYDVGKKEYEGRTYKQDIEVAKDAMSMLLNGAGINSSKSDDNTSEHRKWKPKLILTLGNHEQRIIKATNLDRKLSGTISVEDLDYRKFGWIVVPFLSVRVESSISFSHYFTSGVMDRPITSARALLTKRHCSAIMGHVQRRDIAYDYTADGRQITAIFAGSFYQHDESYMSPQGNKHWRGLWMLHNVLNGEFDEMPVPIGYLREKYSTTKRGLKNESTKVS